MSFFSIRPYRQRRKIRKIWEYTTKTLYLLPRTLGDNIDEKAKKTRLNTGRTEYDRRY